MTLIEFAGALSAVLLCGFALVAAIVISLIVYDRWKESREFREYEKTQDEEVARSRREGKL